MDLVKCSVQLADERITAAGESGLKRPWRGRKVTRIREAGDVGIARRVQRNPTAPIIDAAAEVGGIHQRAAAVQLADERITVGASDVGIARRVERYSASINEVAGVAGAEVG